LARKFVSIIVFNTGTALANSLKRLGENRGVCFPPAIMNECDYCFFCLNADIFNGKVGKFFLWENQGICTVWGVVTL